MLIVFDLKCFGIMRNLFWINVSSIFFISLFFPLNNVFASSGNAEHIAESITAAGDTLNLARTATVTTSFVSGWENLLAVNDGVSSTSSMTKPSAGAYGNWNGESFYNTYNWVQYEWSKAHKLLSTDVYWWIDNTATPAVGISKPTDAYVEYWNGASWIRFGNIGIVLNRFNSIDLGVITSKIRLNMVSGAATGIIEWKVTGVESGPCNPTTLIPYTKIKDEEFRQTNLANVTVGDSVQFDLMPNDGGSFSWSGPAGFLATTRAVTMKNLQKNQGGTYKACFINECGSLSMQFFHLTVSDSVLSNSYIWPAYNPTLNYNFRDEYPSLAEPTRDLNDIAVAGSQSSGWWTFRWGPKAKSLVTSAAITPLLARMNKDFAYFRDSLGWPPDKRAKNGYRSAIYLFGSGLGTDTEDSTALGGWQSAITYGGQSWPMVLASYYPIYSFDPACKYGDKIAQQGAMVHEGIHSILADLPGCKNAAWFHEGGNTWLQQEATVRQTGSYTGMGFLNAGSFIAPFMPIECYSGWLQDGSFGGPSAEGVNMTSGSTQICTWRNMLGGVQYSNIFPTFLGMTLGTGSVAWIWRNCESRVLEGMAARLGDEQMRRLIMEYRAKQAVLDMGKWTDAMKSLIESNFLLAIKAEWSPSWLSPAVWNATPYVKTTNDGNGLLTPEARTLPGWSGANQIPLSVSGNEVVVNFQPLGPNMSCQLCYRTSDGKIVYGNPVFGGDCSLRLDLAPANNVIFAVICNTDYVYEGDTTRKSHFDYRLQLVKGVKSVASITSKWYDWKKVLVSSDDINLKNVNLMVDIVPNPLERGENMNISFSEPLLKPVNVSISNLNGQLVYRDVLTDNASINAGGLLSPGVYLVSVQSPECRQVQKLIIE